MSSKFSRQTQSFKGLSTLVSSSSYGSISEAVDVATRSVCLVSNEAAYFVWYYKTCDADRNTMFVKDIVQGILGNQSIGYGSSTQWSADYNINGDLTAKDVNYGFAMVP